MSFSYVVSIRAQIDVELELGLYVALLLSHSTTTNQNTHEEKSYDPCNLLKMYCLALKTVSLFLLQRPGQEKSFLEAPLDFLYLLIVVPTF